jgi:radical SAM-linked protein
VIPMTGSRRFRFRFSKGDPMRFTGHLDLHHTWERTLRRAGVPIEHSQGYNPRMRINLGLALPLGFTSECELIDVWLEESYAPGELLKAVQSASPPGLSIIDAQAIDAREPTLQQQIIAATYEVYLPDSTSLPDLADRIQILLDTSELPRQRRGKSYDLRPLIEILEIHEADGDAATLSMRLSTRPGATGRPDEVLLALNLDPHTAHIHRKSLSFESM